MPEYFKRVICNQFAPSPEEKAKAIKGESLFFEGQPFKHLGGGRFIVLFPTGDRLMPIAETQWLVRNNPGVEIYNNDEFHAKFVAREQLDSTVIKAKLDELVTARQNITKNELPNT